MASLSAGWYTPSLVQPLTADDVARGFLAAALLSAYLMLLTTAAARA